MNSIFSVFKIYWIEILLGLVILLAADIRGFLFFFFVIFLITITRLFDYLRKLIRVYQVFNELKIIAITRKLKITDEEISIVADSERMNTGKTKWDELEREFKELRNSK